MLPLSNLIEKFPVLAYGKTILTVVVTAGLVGFAAYALHDWSVTRLENQQTAALAAQKETLTNECRKDKQITLETSHGLQTQLADLRVQLAAVKRMQPNRCIPTVARSASGHDDATANPQLPVPHGVFTDDLYDFAADAEQVGRQLDACQGFITRTWEAKGQQ